MESAQLHFFFGGVRVLLDLSQSHLFQLMFYVKKTFHELYRIAAVAALDEATARKRRAAVGSPIADAKKSVG